MRVLVTGAAGYVGSGVVPALRAAGHEVRALLRPGAAGAPHLHGVAVAPGDVVSGAGLAAACAGCGAVVHLVGILRPGPGRTMEGVHVQGTRHVLDAARAAGAGRLVHLSAVGADAAGPTAYLRTKAQSEAAVAAAGLPFTILRPTVVFGAWEGGAASSAAGPRPPVRNLVSELGGLLRAAPVTPVFGDGLYPLQPLSLRNLADAVAGALVHPEAVGRTIEAGGPERLTYLEVLRRIAAAMGRPFRPVHVPVGLVRGVLPVLERLPGFPLSGDQLTMLLRGSTCDPEPFFRLFDLTPEAFAGR